MKAPLPSYLDELQHVGDGDEQRLQARLLRAVERLLARAALLDEELQRAGEAGHARRQGLVEIGASQ